MCNLPASLRRSKRIAALTYVSAPHMHISEDKMDREQLSGHSNPAGERGRRLRTPVWRLRSVHRAALLTTAVVLAVSPSFAQARGTSATPARALQPFSNALGINNPLGIRPGEPQTPAPSAQSQSGQQQQAPLTIEQQQSAPPKPEVQLLEPPGPNSTPPITITLEDALERARKYDAQFQSGLFAAKSAKEDRVQARNAILPTISYTSQALLTEGYGVNRPPIGRFVTQDGVHVYRSWGVFNEDLSPSNYLLATYNHARAAQAIAQARAEIARRGLTVTVTQLYYNLIVAERKYAAAQAASDTAKRFYQVTQDAERVGQVSHSDVIQAEIQYRQQEQAFDEAELAMDNARLDLAVLIFPQLNVNFTSVDDLDSPVALPPFTEAQTLAARENPDLAVAIETLREAKSDVLAARGAFLPDFYTNSVYGIEANDYALHSVNVEYAKDGVLPNLGYFVTAGVNVPVWDWGTLRSKLHQAEFKRDEARIQLSQAQRQLLSNLYSSYNEALVAQNAVDQTRRTAELAAESLRLIDLRYQAGETAALDVVSAENTLTQARNVYADAELRYRVAIATLQTVTGSF
jgi:outer membrane protein TolC